MKTWQTKNGHTITRVLSGRSNVFLLTNGGVNILIDTSPGFLWTKLHRRLKHLNVKYIDYLVLTHVHFDHANNAQNIKNEYTAKVIVHEAEAKYLAEGQPLLTKGSNLFTRFLLNTLSGISATIIKCNPCAYDIAVGERFEFDSFGINAYIIHTPGHSQGSVSLIVDDEIAITGDTLFGIFPWSVFPPFLQDVSKLLVSWRKLLDTGCSLFLPSHGYGVSRNLLEKELHRRLR